MSQSPPALPVSSAAVPPSPGVPAESSTATTAAALLGEASALHTQDAGGVKRRRMAEPVTHFLAASFLHAPTSQSSDLASSCSVDAVGQEGVKAVLPAEAPAELRAVPPKRVRTEDGVVTPQSPFANLPRKVPRKTPVSTPTSSLATPTFVTPPTVASATPSLASTPRSEASAKRITLHQRWTALLHGTFMKERSSDESDRIAELCRRIVNAIPGDANQSRDTFQTLLLSLRDPKNGELRRRVVQGELLVERLVLMDDRELANPELRQEIEKKIEERSKDTNLSEIKKAMRTSNSTLFKCHVCGARDSSWEQRQTRSGDEPMTVIITCNKCNTQWRKY